MIKQYPLIHQGKVRDSFAIDDRHMLIVASDRLSAFDVVMSDPIPGKGEILTRIANFWFERTAHIVPNHLSGIEVDDVIDDPQAAGTAEAPFSCCEKAETPAPGSHCPRLHHRLRMDRLPADGFDLRHRTSNRADGRQTRYPR